MTKKIYLMAAMIFLSAFASAQALEWSGKFGGDGEDVVLAMHTDADGFTYTTGYFTNTCDFDITDSEYLLTTNMDYECFLQKTDPEGNHVWTKSFGSEWGDYGTRITTDTDGNVYLTGVFQLSADFDPGEDEAILTSAGSLDIFVVELTKDGNFVWAKNFEGVEYEESNGIGIDNNGNVYISGYFYNPVDFDPGAGEFIMTPGFSDGFLVKLTTDGDFVWARQFGAEGFELFTGMSVKPNGSAYITGIFEGIVDFDPTEGEAILSVDEFTTGIFLLRVGTYGETLGAVKVAQVQNAGYGLAVTADSNGSAYVTGYLGGEATFETTDGPVTITPIDYFKGYVAKINPEGTIAWAKELPSDGVSLGYCLVTSSTNELFVSGYFNGTMALGPDTLVETNAADTESFIAKMDSDGNFVWGRQYGGIFTVDRSAMSIDSNDNIFVSSAFEGTVDIHPDPTVINEVSSLGFRDNFLIKLRNSALSVEEHQSGETFAVYPNPTQNEIRLSAPKSLDGKAFILYDLAGRQVMAGTVDLGRTVDLSPLQSGMYNLVIGSQTSKVVKQ